MTWQPWPVLCVSAHHAIIATCTVLTLTFALRQALLEQTDVRIAEMKKEAYEFKRDIVVGAENFRSGRTMAEKVIRYMEEKLRQKVGS